MAGRGLNGLRGIIVCYNPHNSRYTLELEAGDMMCLRSRNVRAVRFESGDVESGDGDGCPTALSVDGEASDPSVAVEDASVSSDANRDTSGNFKSSLPNIQNRAEEERGRDGENAAPLQGAPDLLGPITVSLVALFAYMIFENSGQGTPLPTYHSSNHHSGGITTPVLITSLVYTYFAWEWGTKPRSLDNRGDFKLSNVFLRLSFCEAWELALLGGLLIWCLDLEVYRVVSIGLVFFFAWKFGTKDGTQAFSFDNVKTSVVGLNIWHILLLADVLERGLRHVTHVARRR